MIFDPYPKYDGYTFSVRKRNLYLKKMVNEQGKYPLFPDFIADSQLDVSEEEVRRVEGAWRNYLSMRQFVAMQWRSVRESYFSLSPAKRFLVRVEWLSWRGPRTPTYFIYVVRKQLEITTELKRA